MKHLRLLLALAFASTLAVAGPEKPRERPKSAQKDTAVGCVDQRGETYVLTGERQLKTIYTLHGSDFKDDNFARYLGLKVKVTGKLETGDVFRVKQIETLADTCAPPDQEK